MRGERGQTAAEAMGVLLVVSAVVFMLASSDTPAKIAGRTQEIVCEIGGGQCAFTPHLLRRGPAGPGGPLIGGPPIGGGRTFNVLPFPGSVSADCTIENGHRSCRPPAGGRLKVQVGGEVKISRSETTLDEGGCHQTLSISTTLKLTGSGTYEGAKAGGTLSKYFAHSTRYSVTVPPDVADQLASRERELPNPVDPSSLPPGGSILLSKESYDGWGLEANYRALQLELGYDTGTRVSSGITRVSASTVRIYVGDEDFVRQAVSLGVDFKGVDLGVGKTEDLSHGKLHSIDVDITTPAGWEAYQQFVATGRLPQPNGTDVSHRVTSDTITYTGDSEIHVGAGGLEATIPLHSADAHLTTTHNPDGTVTTAVSARRDDVGLVKTTRTDGHGHVLGEPERSLLLHDVDPSLIAGLYGVVGRTPPANPGHDLRLDFTEDQLRRLQQYARSEAGLPHSGLVDDLLAARTPDDVLLALYHGGASAAAVLNQLDILLSIAHAKALPGTVVRPIC